MYKYTYTEFMVDPYYEDTTPAEEHHVCFSKSPKLAVAGEGVKVRRREGGDALTPVLARRTLHRGSKLLWEKWD